MKKCAQSESGEVSAGFEERSESVRGRFDGGGEHVTVDEESVEGETELGRGFDDGIEEEGIGVSNGAKETARVGDGTSGARLCEEFG